MSNREDLIAAARDCLYEKGYARTTARDIAGAAGVSLAAIGYHFGSKEALLTEALQREIKAWGEQEHPKSDEHRPVAEQFTSTWDSLIESFAESGPLWAVQFELMALLRRDPELRKTFGDTNEAARRGLLELFGSAGFAQAGVLYQAMLVGLAALAAADPDSMPSGKDLLDAIRVVAERAGTPEPRPGKRLYALILFSDGDSDMNTGCGTWSEDMQAAGIWRGALGLDPEAKGNTVRVREGQVVLGDGPFAETKDLIGGIAVIECADLDEAVEVAAKHPFAKAGQIEIRPLWTGNTSNEAGLVRR
ncbi:YciI family protein [Labedaea rhizosphaerae]|uniref:TetR family transcriptional regulator n=1 Tax=Labedaea rhizosphaerae TaxID=598644 RepID=A0A4R6RWD0_LABRH|nr:TetR family transcriptional regulator [Labedaea rhizosphaerae]